MTTNTRFSPVRALTNLNVSDIKVQPAAADSTDQELSEQTAEKLGFTNREPKVIYREKKKAPRQYKKEPRWHRTGRNVVLTMKASQDTIDRFVALAEKNKWVMGETLEQAVAALEEKLSK